MSRWHESSCTAPLVYVEDGIPKCQSCGRMHNLTELLATEAAVSSAPTIPVNKLAGQMNLWWPRTVPYSQQDNKSFKITVDANTKNTLADQESVRQALEGPTKVATTDTSSTTEVELAGSTIYPRPLEPEEFRLICLSAAECHGSPVHLDLESYSLSDCPEYETVSYTWAGEDGDNAFRHPVYIGRYWDILLQTKNCWEMLRFMRPQRGLRLLWVDAVCINQADIPERSNQVAKMNRIYSGCTRVVVYLGPDIAVPSDGRYARRCRLHELEAGTVIPNFPKSLHHPQEPPKLKALLERRYFSRIWVIQELMLSQHVLVRVGDVDFWADPVMSTYMSSQVPGWSWASTAAPWVQNLAQGASVATSIYEAIQTTSQAQSTDPRDRIFGLLGAMPRLFQQPASQTNDNPLYENDVQADYSLSCDHVFIGTFGHCLINKRAAQILYHASGIKAVDHYPSWAPDWRLPKTWSYLFKVPSITMLDVYEPIQKHLELQRVQNVLPYEAVMVCRFVGWAADHIREHRQWHDGAHIDGSTGALRLNLTQLFCFHRPPICIDKVGTFQIFKLCIGKNYAAYMASDCPLDEVSGFGNEQMFVLNVGNNLIIHLVLRPVVGFKRTFTLIAACPIVFIAITVPASINKFEIEAIRWEEMHTSLFSVLSDIFEQTNKQIEYKNLESKTARRFFPGVETHRDLLPFYAAFCSGKYDFTPKQLEYAYRSCFKLKRLPSIKDGYVYLRFSRDEWRTGFWIYYIEQEGFFLRNRHALMIDNPWEHRSRDGSWKSAVLPHSSFNQEPGAGTWKDDDAEVRCRLTELHSYADRIKKQESWIGGWLRNHLDNYLHCLYTASSQSGEDVLAMLARDLRQDDDYIETCVTPLTPGSRLFHKFRHDLKTIGSKQMISIL